MFRKNSGNWKLSHDITFRADYGVTASNLENKIIHSLCNRLGLDSKKELVDYYKNIFCKESNSPSFQHRE